MKKKTKTALIISACLFVIWWALGTGATLAWFSDTDQVRNEFQIGLLNLDVSYRNDQMTEYQPLYGSTAVFNDSALYEPGYTQVVYLKIENKGDVDFNYKVAVTVADFTEGMNAWGDKIYLPNFLRYGVVFAESEEALKTQVADRLQAQSKATNDGSALGTWSKVSEYTFEVGEKPHYAALIVYMPTDVNNQANYRGTTPPQVELGITVFAQQAGTKME